MNTDLAALQELVELAEKATPGPWENSGDGWILDVPADPEEGAFICQMVELHSGELNNKFICAARNAMPALSRLLEAGVPEGYRLIPQDALDNLIERRDKLRKMADAESLLHRGLYVIDQFISECHGPELESLAENGAAPNHPPSEGDK